MIKKKKKPNKTEGIFQTRIDLNLREAFIKSCEDIDTTASREVRNFMRKFVAQNGQKKLL